MARTKAFPIAAVMAAFDEAALRKARIDALEEAAKVAADFFEPRLSDPLWTVRNLAQMDIAAAIRKLKETGRG